MGATICGYFSTTTDSPVSIAGGDSFWGLLNLGGWVQEFIMVSIAGGDSFWGLLISIIFAPLPITVSIAGGDSFWGLLPLWVV